MWWSLLIPIVLLCQVKAFTESSNSTNSTSGQNVSLIQPEINSRNFNLKGVTIGGWLVLEPYITPSLFLAFNATNGTEADIPIDEYRYCEVLGYEEAQRRLHHHWDSFYNESDFADIKQLGLNMVRIPIGYWAFEQKPDDPYVKGAQDYLDKAIEWADKYDLKVWVDLHGVPGSQNGFDNSGYRDIGYPGWFNSTENEQLSAKVLTQIYTKYGSEQYRDIVIGIEVVNEPLSTELSIHQIAKFYKNAYADARKYQQVNNTIVFHDAFKELGYWNNFLDHTTNSTNKTSNNYNIMIDHHHYEVFDAGALNMTIKGHLDSIKGYSSAIEQELNHHPAVVGEWLAALTDCTPWLNGVGLGTRYEGTKPYTNDAIGKCDDINDFDRWTNDRKKGYRKFIEMQLDQYDTKTSGWIFWCYKTETAIEWDLKRLVALELFPQPLDDRKYIVNGTDTDVDADTDDDETIGHTSSSNTLTVPLLWLLWIMVTYL